jgi:hypothetical protein
MKRCDIGFNEYRTDMISGYPDVQFIQMGVQVKRKIFVFFSIVYNSPGKILLRFEKVCTVIGTFILRRKGPIIEG